MSEDIDQIMLKLRKAVEGGNEFEIFSKSEVVALRRVIKLVDMFESWGKLGKWLFWLLTMFASAIIAYDQIMTKVSR